jgi:uncharacterized cupredoxin-like copper-binding protein
LQDIKNGPLQNLRLFSESLIRFHVANRSKILRKQLILFKIPKEKKMKTKKSLAMFLALALLIVPILTACGPTKINGTLTTYTFTLSADTASAGTIVFHVTNSATDQNHEFVIFKTDLPVDKLPMKDSGDGSGTLQIDEEGAGVEHIAEIPDTDLTPGTTKDLTVDLKPGRYVIVCNLVVNGISHFMQGMHAVLTVK